jgi:hypothetical protein
MGDRVSTMIGRKIGRAYASMSNYQTVVGQPTFGISSLSRHGFDTTGRGIEEEVGCGGKRIDKYSAHLDEYCRWKMQSQGKTQEIRTAPRDHVCDDERDDSSGCQMLR